MRMTKKEGRRERQRWREAMKGKREKGNVTRERNRGKGGDVLKRKIRGRREGRKEE